MYERFTDRARRVMQLANQEAQRFNHEYIGTEHMLLGIVKEGTGTAATVLKNRDISLNKIRIGVEKLVQSGPEMITMGKLPQTPRTKKVIEFSMIEARDLQQNFVGTEHLLLGLLRIEEGVACQVLMDLGLKFDELRKDVLKQSEINALINDDYEDVDETPKKSKTPALDNFTRDITKQAKENKLTPVIGRETEIERLTTVLSRRDRHNAILIGDSGSGKRTIIHGLAQKIADRKARQSVADFRIVVLDQALLVAGTKYRGQFEERVKAIVNEMRRSKNIILFVPQIHSLARLGLMKDEGLSAFEMLKFAMFQDQIKCIGICTEAEYDEYVSQDSDLNRLFQLIPIKPLTNAETLEILKGTKQIYEAYHHVEIQDEALQAAVELSDIYLPEEVMPERAINLIDEACARLSSGQIPPDDSETQDQISKVQKQKEAAVAAKKFDEAAKLRNKEQELRKKVKDIWDNWKSETGTIGTVEVKHVVSALSLETGVSVQDIVERKKS